MEKKSFWLVSSDLFLTKILSNIECKNILISILFSCQIGSEQMFSAEVTDEDYFTGFEKRSFNATLISQATCGTYKASGQQYSIQVV